MPSYIIADTHGCLITLRHLLEEKIGVGKDDKLYFLGDFIDRGPFSAQLVDYLINLKDLGYKLIALRGNHEQMILDARNNISAFQTWMYNEGSYTLKSYKDMLGIFFKFPNDLPDKHLLFFLRLPHYHEIDSKFLLVHGAFNYRAQDPFKDKEAMIWNRPQEVPQNFMLGKVIIHGHTPTPISSIKSIIDSPDCRLIPLDAGCVYGSRRQGLGHLVALELESFTLHSVKKMED